MQTGAGTITSIVGAVLWVAGIVGAAAVSYSAQLDLSSRAEGYATVGAGQAGGVDVQPGSPWGIWLEERVVRTAPGEADGAVAVVDATGSPVRLEPDRGRTFHAQRDEGAVEGRLLGTFRPTGPGEVQVSVDVPHPDVVGVAVGPVPDRGGVAVQAGIGAAVALLGLVLLIVGRRLGRPVEEEV